MDSAFHSFPHKESLALFLESLYNPLLLHYNGHMVIYKSFNNPKLTELIRAGGIGVIPTDTIYGLVCSASDKEAVEKIFEIKGRDMGKPPIILISDTAELKSFGVTLSERQLEFLKKNWPGTVSVVLPTSSDKLDYLSRGLGTLTFRLPKENKLISLLQKTGPLIAPSANLQSQEPAHNIDEVMNYFIGQIDFVVDGGEIVGKSSTLVDLTGSSPKVLRQGDAKI